MSTIGKAIFDALTNPPVAEKPVAEREAALYDPDSVFRDHAAEAAARKRDGAAPAEPESGGAELYARSEKRRAGAGLTKEMIKRIADRAEQSREKKAP